MSATIDWITAAEALRIATAGFGADDAAKALVAGAESGAIKTRAARFAVEVPNACGQKARFEDDLAELPPEFWSSEGRVTVEQDWDAGRFLTWSTPASSIRPVGVEFDRAADRGARPDGRLASPAADARCSIPVERHFQPRHAIAAVAGRPFDAVLPPGKVEVLHSAEEDAEGGLQLRQR